jgi:hypothetical protein
VNNKTMLDWFSIHQKMLQVLVAISLKVLLQTWGYAKVIHKKEKKS